jgi:hypothetical protein
MVLLLVVAVAGAGPVMEVEEPKGQQIVVVTDPSIEGTVNLKMPGREGDTVFVDGWKVGTLPVETVLAMGLHEFRIEGPSGKTTFAIPVTPKPGKVVDLVLEPPPPPTPPTPSVGS